MATRVEKNKKKRERSRREHEEYLRALAVRNEFFAAMQRILIALNIDPIYLKQLPDYVKKILVHLRSRSVRLVVSDGLKPSRRLLDQMRLTLSQTLAQTTTPVFPGYGKVTLEDFLTAGLSLYYYFNDEKNLEEEEEFQLRQKLSPFIDSFIKINSLPFKNFTLLLDMIGGLFSRMNQSIFYFNQSVHRQGSGIDLKISASVTLCQKKAEIRHVIIDGKARPAYRVGWLRTDRGVRWVKLTARKLGIHSSFADLPLDVYAQSHTFIRMRERLDTLFHYEFHIMLYCSLYCMEKNIHYKNSILIPAILYNITLGYFPIEIVEGMVLVKTYLFITNSGTPEGDRLDKELNAGKIEKEFLKIDKLSTFVNTDLPHDPKIREIFENAGLGALCTLNRTHFTRIKKVWSGFAADFMKYMDTSDRDYR